MSTRPLIPIAAFATLMLLASSSALAQAQRNVEVHGLELVAWSKKVDEDRYISGRDFEGSIKHFRDKFRGWKTVKWSREVSLPTVKYVHIENLSENAAWQGVNIYQLRNGEVRLYVLPRLAKAPATPKAP
jgi:hypothetical protein